MDSIIIYTVITLSSTGALAAVVLYFVAQKFKVLEDPRIDDVEKMLSGANCGGCGFPGCRKLAEALVKSETMDGLYCPPAGNEVMGEIAKYLGKAAQARAQTVAVVRCNGTCEVRPKTSNYDGAKSCKIAAISCGGDTACQYGCLSFGDCVSACTFDAIYMNETTGLPVVITEKCTSCGACVKACPKNLIELRKTNKKDMKIYVACMSKDKGAVAKKACGVACIGCGKCQKVCPHDAIVLENNLAYIDSEKCKLCRKCVTECPTNSIIETNFPVKKPKEDSTVIEQN
ncbi:MAG: RnfABCDGE type electron transport complex subunit B [Bacteroidales bacterium]